MEKRMDSTALPTSPITMPSKPVPSAGLPRDLWSAALPETIVEVFFPMVGAAATTAPTDVPLATTPSTGTVGMAGAIRANFILRCSDTASTTLSFQMLGILPDDPDSPESFSRAGRDL